MPYQFKNSGKNNVLHIKEFLDELNGKYYMKKSKFGDISILI